MAATSFLVFLVVIISTSSCDASILRCPGNNFLSAYIEKLENATEAAISNIKGIVVANGAAPQAAAGPSNATTLYTALTTAHNITPSTEGLNNFSAALDVITESHFKSCYGPVEERPTTADSPAILNEFLSLLQNRTDITRARELFGRLSCLQNFTTNSDIPQRRKRQMMLPVPDLLQCAQAPTLKELYDCLDVNDTFDCIFNLNDPQNCQNSDNLSVKNKKHCLAFVVDTTGSMSEEISHARQVIGHFIQSEENEITLCYALVPFNDYTGNDNYVAWPNETNLDFGRIYDTNCLSNDTYGCQSFSMTDGSMVYGVDRLLIDIDSLTATGGADCPEYGMTGILKAIDLIDKINRPYVQTEGRHNIIVLTDASAKDNNLYQQVINTAKSPDKPDVTVHFFYSGSGCSGSFGNYEDVKNATGGQSVNQIDATNFQSFVDYITASYEVNPNVAIGESNTPESSSSTIVITKPDNTTETISTFANSFAVYKVTNPQAGNWKACVGESYTLSHSLNPTIALELNVDFLVESSDGELLPTNLLPFACDVHTFTIKSSDLPKISLQNSLYLDIIDNYGDTLQYEELSECAGYLSGSLTIPTGTKQYQLRGYDSNGIPFAHPVPNSFITFNVPELQVNLNGLSSKSVVLNPGGSSLVRFSITNTKKGPENLMISATISVLSGIQVQFLTEPSMTLLPQQSPKELSFMFHTPAVLDYGQELSWNINIIDICNNLHHVVNYTAIIKQSIPFNITDTSATMISFEWSPPSGDYNVTNYTLTFDYTNGTVVAVPVSANIKEYSVNELSPYQQVYVSIIAYMQSGETAEIAPISVLTDESVPGPVSQLSTRPLSLNSIDVYWSLPKQQNGIILYYELVIPDLYNSIHNSSVTSVAINNLEPYVRYTAVVTAATSVGKGQPVNIQFYSLEGIPVQSPYYTSHTVVSPNAVTIKWSPPPIEYRRGFITQYTVHIEYNGEGTLLYNTFQNNLTVSGLPDFADLNVSVLASTSAGQGPLSEPFVIHIATAVSSAPRNFTVTSSSTTTVLLSWTIPEFPNGKIIYYRLYYKQVEESQYSTLNIFSYEVDNYHSLDDLNSEENYHFLLAAINYAGHGMNTSQVEVLLASSGTSAGVIAVATILPLLLILIAVAVIIGITLAVIYRYRLKSTSKQESSYTVGEYENVDPMKRKKGFVEEKVDHYEDLAMKQLN